MLSKEIQEKCLEYLSEINTIERVKIISQELLKRSVHLKLKKYLDPPSKMYYLEDNTNISERENIIRILSQCRCCKEHERERPSLIDYNNGYMPEYPNPSIDWKLDTLLKIGKDSCNCYCRFVCRYICRIDNDEIILN